MTDAISQPAYRTEAFAEAVRACLGDPAESALLASFLEQYRLDATAEDFIGVAIADAARLAADLWTGFLDARGGACATVRVRRAKAGPVAEIIAPDMAFIVDSAIIAFQEARLDIGAVLHPVLRDAQSAWSLVQIRFDGADEGRMRDLEVRLQTVMGEVSTVNAHHAAMRDRMRGSIADISRLTPGDDVQRSEIAEALAFLSWLEDDHFTFLGVRDYRYARASDGRLAAEEPAPLAGTGLGLLADPAARVLNRAAEPLVVTPSVQAFLEEPSPVIVAKASFISRIHRRTHADYIGVKCYSPSGEVVGERRFVGLFTSEAYTRAADETPLIRRKIARVLERSRGSSRFSMKRMSALLQSFPRDELFQIAEDELERIARGALQLQIRPRTHAFFRKDRFGRYVSVLLYTPRDNFSSDLRARAHRVIADAFGGRASAHYPYFADGPLARVHLIVGLGPDAASPDEAALNETLGHLFETWEERLARAAREKGLHSSDIDDRRFSMAYREAFAAEEALKDIAAADGLDRPGAMRVRVCDGDDGAMTEAVKIYHRGPALSLSDMTPVLENMGLRVLTEASYEMRAGSEGRHQATLHRIAVERPAGAAHLADRFERAVEAIWSGRTENDGFNSLIVLSQADWREAALVRTLARWRSQTGLDPSESVQIAALREHPHIAEKLIRLFAIRFDPALGLARDARVEAASTLGEAIETDLRAVPSIDADRVLRRIMGLIRACVRTNLFSGADVDETSAGPLCIAIKIDPAQAGPLPEPRPFREIFVCAPDVEGVHLRFGSVSRGGLRWSDRRDDFRTEVLGLVKAQQVKNAVIVPVGAKGGFYPKRLPRQAGREAVQAAGIAAYERFVDSLLALTDNIVDGRTAPPADAIVWDEDDPYLVVAADKGTASFSDRANALARRRGYWLDDAFASGGSAGYDHKKMGITARGAWVAVARHFREMGIDVATTPFSAVGIGDMSGDVFGNGMLRSRATRLVGAFNHEHIFIDPDPADTAAAFAERERLFRLPRSTWADYDRRLISSGGGVFERAAKSIPVSPQMAGLLGLEEGEIVPDQLIRALLCAPVDLLWFAGIGAYIKASAQTHAEVGDRANDAVRVDAGEVRARVIAEGANLGVTQAGRIEYARKGGRINTDAIDNSAGVDSSDHEVNIKILLRNAIASGALASSDRDELLASMTDEVADLVLTHNYEQTGALSVWQATARSDLAAHEQFMDRLEASGRLNRRVEGLPGRESIAAMRGSGLGLTRPELAVLMAYAKLDAFSSVIASPAPDDPAFEPLLESYFPRRLSGLREARHTHRLRREIIATRLANRIVNLAGPTFFADKRDLDGYPAEAIIGATEAARRLFAFDALLEAVNGLDGQAAARVQAAMVSELALNLRTAASLLLSSGRAGSVSAILRRYERPLATLIPAMADLASAPVRSRAGARSAAYMADGAPADLAMRIGSMRIALSGLEVADAALDAGRDPLPAARVHHRIGDACGIDALRAACRDLDPQDRWEALAVQRLTDELPAIQTRLTAAALRGLGDGAGAEEIALDRLMAKLGGDAARIRNAAAEALAGGSFSLARLVLLSDDVRQLARAGEPSGPAQEGRKT